MCEMNFCGGRLSRLDNLIPPQGPASNRRPAGQGTEPKRKGCLCSASGPAGGCWWVGEHRLAKM